MSNEEILEIINSLENKSTGPSSIPHKMLSVIPDLIILPLAYIINMSLLTGEYPDLLCIPMIRTTNYGIKSIICSGPLLWNQMLRNKLFIDQPKSVSSFKVAVKNYYLGSYSSNKLV